MFLGWYDPDKKLAAIDKYQDARSRYVQRFGVEPEMVLASPEDADDLRTADPGLDVQSAVYIPRHTHPHARPGGRRG